MKKILFVSVENAGRSQMAEGFAEHYGSGNVEAISAGTMPSTKVDPIVIQVMPNQDVETYTVKAMTNREEAEKLIALGYEFHYRTQDGVDLFRKKVIGLD